MELQRVKYIQGANIYIGFFHTERVCLFTSPEDSLCGKESKNRLGHCHFLGISPLLIISRTPDQIRDTDSLINKHTYFLVQSSSSV